MASKLQKQISLLFSKSFDALKENWLSLILGMIVTLVGSIFIITMPPLIFGYYILCMDALKGKDVNTMDVMKGFHYFFRSWGIVLLMVLIVLALYVPAILLFRLFFALSAFLPVMILIMVVPVSLLAMMFIYTVPLSIKKNLGAVDSMKASYSLAKKNFGFTVSLIVLLFAINTASRFVPFLFLLAMPFTYLVISASAMRL